MTPDANNRDPDAGLRAATGHLTEWVKQIVTISSALMVLGTAFLKDLLKGLGPPWSYVVAGLLIVSYGCLLVAVWGCLGFIRSAANVVLTADGTGVAGTVLAGLEKPLKRAQKAFWIGLLVFAAVAAVTFLAWAHGPGPAAAQPACNVAPAPGPAPTG